MRNSLDDKEDVTPLDWNTSSNYTDIEPMQSATPEYIFDVNDKPSLPLHNVPLIRATDESVKGYGCLVSNPDKFEIEIT